MLINMHEPPRSLQQGQDHREQQWILVVTSLNKDHVFKTTASFLSSQHQPFWAFRYWYCILSLSFIIFQNPISEREYLKQLPDKSTLLFGMRLAKTLSGRGTRSLGEWDIRFQYDREAVAAENR